MTMSIFLTFVFTLSVMASDCSEKLSSFVKLNESSLSAKQRESLEKGKHGPSVNEFFIYLISQNERVFNQEVYSKYESKIADIFGETLSFSLFENRVKSVFGSKTAMLRYYNLSKEDKTIPDEEIRVFFQELLDAEIILKSREDFELPAVRNILKNHKKMRNTKIFNMTINEKFQNYKNAYKELGFDIDFLGLAIKEKKDLKGIEGIPLYDLDRERYYKILKGVFAKKKLPNSKLGRKQNQEKAFKIIEKLAEKELSNEMKKKILLELVGKESYRKNFIYRINYEEMSSFLKEFHKKSNWEFSLHTKEENMDYLMDSFSKVFGYRVGHYMVLKFMIINQLNELDFIVTPKFVENIQTQWALNGHGAKEDLGVSEVSYDYNSKEYIQISKDNNPEEIIINEEDSSLVSELVEVAQFPNEAVARKVLTQIVQESEFDPQKIARKLNLDINEVLSIFVTLSEKKELWRFLM